MRILKYFFLLFLLLCVAMTVFVATQPGDYSITRKKEIKIAKEVIFNFVSDSTSIADWNPWKKNEASFNTSKIVSKDSIQHIITINDEINKSVIQFQKTTKGTLITWKLSGKLSFKLKLVSVLQGGIATILGNELETGLNNINTYLVKELTDYGVITSGLVTKRATNYIQQQDTCNQKDFQKISKTMLQNMMSFVKKNEIAITGLPFIIYKNRKTFNGKVIFAMCVPVKEEILTTENSEISGGHFDDFLAVKTVLRGDYSHSNEAWNKAFLYIKGKKLVEDETGKYIEVYKVSLPKERKPSNWITEIYIPVKKKGFVPRVEKTVITEEVTTLIENTNKNKTIK